MLKLSKIDAIHNKILRGLRLVNNYFQMINILGENVI